MAQDKYTRSARGQECQVRIPSVCNFDPDTTVFAHLNGAGMGMKRASIHGAYACSACHDFYDGRASRNEWMMHNGQTMADIHAMFYEGVFRTQEIMIKEGILKL